MTAIICSQMPSPAGTHLPVRAWEGDPGSETRLVFKNDRCGALFFTSNLGWDLGPLPLAMLTHRSAGDDNLFLC